MKRTIHSLQAATLKPDTTNHRTRALIKLKRELQKDIGKAALLARHCGLWEILRFAYLLHFARLQTHLPEMRDLHSHSEILSSYLFQDAVKYAISLAARNGSWSVDPDAIASTSQFSNELVNSLLQLCTYINAKFETETILHVANVRVMGERDQVCEYDMRGVMNDPERARMMNYGLRLDQTTFNTNSRSMNIDDLVAKFRAEYIGVADLFEFDAGISLDGYCQGILDLDVAMTTRGRDVLPSLGMNADGTVNALHASTFFGLARTMFMTNTEFQKVVSPGFLAYMKRNRFDPKKVSNSELRFHGLTRRPFLFGDGFVVIIPELIADSVFANTHFALLERPETKARYMERRSQFFIDRIAGIALQHGYREIGREIFLNYGKQKLGDIDLALHHDDSNHTLLVEGKGHALPLGVYFKSPKDTADHLTRTSDWEKKVSRRIGHLTTHDTDFQLSAPWDYVIVTQHPEVLSHVASVLTLSLDEFQHWLGSGRKAQSFDEVFQECYRSNESKMSIQEMQKMYDDGFTLMNPTAMADREVLQTSPD
jgi:hypothetical protein